MLSKGNAWTGLSTIIITNSYFVYVNYMAKLLYVCIVAHIASPWLHVNTAGVGYIAFTCVLQIPVHKSLHLKQDKRWNSQICKHGRFVMPQSLHGSLVWIDCEP